jgi:HD-GYP domain-containing protein (c-di-GMP phosphodiesterase class II)
MLKKIAVDDLVLGMHLHGFEAAWVDHPFWRTKFTLKDPGDLAAIRASAVRECWIDVAKGADLPPPVPGAAPSLAAAPPTVPPPAAPAAVAFDEELRRASALCQRSRDAVLQMFGEARMGRALDTAACAELVEDVSASVFRNPGALISLARLKTVDDYTYMHSVAVCALMVALGRTLGMDEAQCRQAGLAGLIHDMGKATIPLSVLNKPGKLTPEEFEIIKSHPARGHALLSEAQGVAEEALDVVLHHHERLDGRGYPKGLAGDAISRLARMGAVCDVYDAVTSNRPYKAGWDPAESIAHMASWQGHFDRTIFAAFVKTVGIHPTGSIVRLASGRLAVVAEQNAGAPTTPVVKVFYSTKANLRLPPERVDLAKSGDRIVGREPRGAWPAAQLDGLWAGDLLG